VWNAFLNTVHIQKGSTNNHKPTVIYTVYSGDEEAQDTISIVKRSD